MTAHVLQRLKGWKHRQCIYQNNTNAAECRESYNYVRNNKKKQEIIKWIHQSRMDMHRTIG